MSKKIVLLLILIFVVFLSGISFYFYQYSKTDVVKKIKENNSVNILFMVKDFSNKENSKLKFFIARYGSLDKYIKICFINENITILQKKVKSRTLKEMILSVKEDKQIEFAKTEIEKLLDNQINIDYCISLDRRNLKSIVKLFSRDENLEYNLALNGICFNENIDRTEMLISSMRLINYIKTNTSFFDYIKFIKYLKNKNIFLETKCDLRDMFFLCRYFMSNKIIRYADIPTLQKRHRIESDETNKEKIIEFFNTNKEKQNGELKVQILNATKKSRLAIKAADKLRQNNFDVVEFGSSSKKYENTIIFDLVDNYEQANEVTNVLMCGEVIFVPKELLITETIVYLGQDCNIYDKLDRHDKN